MPIWIAIWFFPIRHCGTDMATLLSLESHYCPVYETQTNTFSRLLCTADDGSDIAALRTHYPSETAFSIRSGDAVSVP